MIDLFLLSAKDWLCDSGSLHVRYIATPVDGSLRIVEALLSFGPRPVDARLDFSLKAGSLVAGQKTFPSVTRKQALARIAEAIEGRLEVGRMRLHLHQVEAKNYYSEMSQRDRWFADLHLQITGAQLPHPDVEELRREDYALRTGTPPFDGTSDLTSWLGLADRRGSHQSCCITIRVASPIDFLFERSALTSNELKVALISHPRVDLNKVSVALRAYPGNGLDARRQVGSHIAWKKQAQGLRPGTLTVTLENADSALVMLSFGAQTVRRQWFLDPEKATNTRLVAMQCFDRELKQLRQALFENTDSAKFEQAISAVLFLLGFAPGPQLETQAPDLVVISPAGHVALVECTTRISDLRAKVGKLVDRRRALVVSLEASGHAMRVDAFLVSSQPRDQVVSEARHLAEHKITLLCREDIAEALSRSRLPSDPDKLLEQAAQRLAASQSPIG